MIYFDNAATSYPKPRFTLDAVGEAFRRYGANPGRGGHKMAIETSEMVFKARQELITLLGGGDRGDQPGHQGGIARGGPCDHLQHGT